MTTWVDLVAAIGLTFFLLVAVAMVAGALWVFAHAFRELQFARAATLSNDTTAETLRASHDAVDEIRGHRDRIAREPEYASDNELRLAAFEQTMAEMGVEGAEMPEHYVTTEDNAMRTASTNGHSEGIDRDFLYNEEIAER